MRGGIRLACLLSIGCLWLIFTIGPLVIEANNLPGQNPNESISSMKDFSKPVETSCLSISGIMLLKRLKNDIGLVEDLEPEPDVQIETGDSGDGISNGGDSNDLPNCTEGEAEENDEIEDGANTETVSDSKDEEDEEDKCAGGKYWIIAGGNVVTAEDESTEVAESTDEEGDEVEETEVLETSTEVIEEAEVESEDIEETEVAETSAEVTEETGEVVVVESEAVEEDEVVETSAEESGESIGDSASEEQAELEESAEDSDSGEQADSEESAEDSASGEQVDSGESTVDSGSDGEAETSEETGEEGEEVEEPVPIAYWSFDEGGGISVEDSSGNDNGGTLNIESWESGVSGTCINFDGNTYVEVQDSESLNPEIFTVEAWVCPTDLTNLEDNWDIQTIVNKGYRWGLRIDHYNGVNRIRFYTNPSGRRFGSVCYPVEEGEWIHVAGVFDGTQMRLYIDGELVNTASQSCSPGSLDNLHNLFIGSSGGNPTDPYYMFRGYIDEVRIYGTALIQEQIQEDMNETGQGPVLYYDFNDEIVEDRDVLYFDGSNYVEVPNSTSLNPDTFTVEMRLCPTDLSNLEDNWDIQTLINKGYRWGLRIDLYGGVYWIRFYTNPSGGRFRSLCYPVEEGEWIHVAGVFDGTQMRLYINGELVGTASQSCPSGSLDSPNNLFIGSSGGNPTDPYYMFNGYIDEVKIYNRALSEEEIMAEVGVE